MRHCCALLVFSLSFVLTACGWIDKRSAQLDERSSTSDVKMIGNFLQKYDWSATEYTAIRRKLTGLFPDARASAHIRFLSDGTDLGRGIRNVAIIDLKEILGCVKIRSWTSIFGRPKWLSAKVKGAEEIATIEQESEIDSALQEGWEIYSVEFSNNYNSEDRIVIWAEQDTACTAAVQILNVTPAVGVIKFPKSSVGKTESIARRIIDYFESIVLSDKNRDSLEKEFSEIFFESGLFAKIRYERYSERGGTKSEISYLFEKGSRCVPLSSWKDLFGPTAELQFVIGADVRQRVSAAESEAMGLSSLAYSNIDSVSFFLSTGARLEIRRNYPDPCVRAVVFNEFEQGVN